MRDFQLLRLSRGPILRGNRLRRTARAGVDLALTLNGYGPAHLLLLISMLVTIMLIHIIIFMAPSIYISESLSEDDATN